MVEVVLTKHMRLFPDAPLVRPGVPVVVDEELAARLRGMGVVKGEDAEDTEDGDGTPEDESEDEGEASPEDDDEEAPDDPAPTKTPKTGLPSKTANVSTWRDWAKANDIKIPSGMTKRAEIVGFITNAVKDKAN